MALVQTPFNIPHEGFVSVPKNARIVKATQGSGVQIVFEYEETEAVMEQRFFELGFNGFVPLYPSARAVAIASRPTGDGETIAGATVFETPVKDGQIEPGY